MNKEDLIAKVLFMEKMGHLLDAGVSLYKSLQILQSEIDNPKAQGAIGKLLKGIDEQEDEFKLGECLDEDYFKESERIMIGQGALAGRPDRSFLVVAQWLEKELLGKNQL